MQVTLKPNQKVPGMVAEAGWQPRTLAIAIAIAANLGVLMLARIIAGEPPLVTRNGNDQPIGAVQVLLVTLGAGLAAWGLLAMLERLTDHARTTWTTLSLVVLAISLIGPLGTGANLWSKGVLALMHVATAVTMIAFERRNA